MDKEAILNAKNFLHEMEIGDFSIGVNMEGERKIFISEILAEYSASQNSELKKENEELKSKINKLNGCYSEKFNESNRLQATIIEKDKECERLQNSLLDVSKKATDKIAEQQRTIDELRGGLQKIEQMSDPGSPERGITYMKGIATSILSKLKTLHEYQ